MKKVTALVGSAHKENTHDEVGRENHTHAKENYQWLIIPTTLLVLRSTIPTD